MPDIVPVTQEHPIPGGEVRLLGACDSVTGAMTMVDFGHARILVDCGMPQGRAAKRWSFPEEARDADALVLTHAHLEHVGSLPKLFAYGWRGAVYGTAATRDIVCEVLSDAIRVEGGTVADAEEFLQEFHNRFFTLNYNQALKGVGGLDGPLWLREAGHILGSVSVEIETQGARVIVSGALGRPGVAHLPPPHTAWEKYRPVDLVVLESTYGDREHMRSDEELRDALHEIVGRAIDKGGHVLLPGFAIGRAQALLGHIDALVNEGRLPELPLAIEAPMGLHVAPSYRRCRSLYDPKTLGRIHAGEAAFDLEHFYAVSEPWPSRSLKGGEPMLVIAGDEMCVAGPILDHLRELLPLPETCLLFLGYPARGTLGLTIQSAARKRDEQGDSDSPPVVSLAGAEVELRADVHTLPGLSAHADRTELRAWLDDIPDVRRVALHHGERDVQHKFASWLSAPLR